MIGGRAGVREVLYVSSTNLLISTPKTFFHGGLLKARPQKLGNEHIDSCLHIPLYVWI